VTATCGHSYALNSCSTRTPAGSWSRPLSHGLCHVHRRENVRDSGLSPGRARGHSPRSTANYTLADNPENVATLLSGFGVRVPDGAQNTRSDRSPMLALSSGHCFAIVLVIRVQAGQGGFQRESGLGSRPNDDDSCRRPASSTAGYVPADPQPDEPTRQRRRGSSPLSCGRCAT
jgi:hypothetical protein